jgi:hypothetical protein
MKKDIKGLIIACVLGVFCSSVYAYGFKPSTGATLTLNTTARALSSTSLPYHTLELKAGINNTGAVYYGASGVNSTTGVALNAGDVKTFSGNTADYNGDAKFIYVVADNANDTVTYVPEVVTKITME